MAETTPTMTPPPVATAHPAPPHDPNAAKRAEDAKQAHEKNRADANKRLDEADKARAEAIAERSEWEAGITPTPTQRENDLAKLGLLDIDAKQDDGSGPERPSGPLRREAMSGRSMESTEPSPKYKTK